MRVRSILQTIFGVLTYIPGVYGWRSRRLGSGGTQSAAYCYSVWMRHIVMLNSNKPIKHPSKVAELGPGDSIGIGLTALLLGAEKYYAFDVVEFASMEHNLKIFNELIMLVRRRAPIPYEGVFSRIQPSLDEYEFPSKIYTNEYIENIVQDKRIELIRKSILDPKKDNSMIVYKAPWFRNERCLNDEVDLIYSQAVLEHVDDLKETYQSMRLWLKDGGLMSHSIDFKSHGYSEQWDGHWKISALRWRLLRGNRPYMLNRRPYSYHVGLIKENNFIITVEKLLKREPSTQMSKSKKYCYEHTADDRYTSGAYIQALATK